MKKGNYRDALTVKVTFVMSDCNGISSTEFPRTIREALYKITNCLQIKVLILK